MNDIDTELRKTWDTAFDIGLKMQNEALQSARDAADAGLVVQRAAIAGVRSGLDHLMTVSVPTAAIEQAADTIARATPTSGGAGTQEGIKRNAAEALRATIQAPVEGVRHLMVAVWDPYEKMIEATKKQVDTAAELMTNASRQASEVNRQLTLAWVDSWSSLAGSPPRWAADSERKG
ncbi:MAG: hypothetical protein WDA16_00435 [Candidatus Thermoplasmatota archaeon]